MFINNKIKYLYYIILIILSFLSIYIKLNFQLYTVDYKKNYFFSYKSDFSSSYTLAEYGRNLEWNITDTLKKNNRDHLVFGSLFFVNNGDIHNLNSFLYFINNLDKKIVKKKIYKNFIYLTLNKKNYLFINKKFINDENFKIFQIYNFYKSFTNQDFANHSEQDFTERRFSSFCKNLKITYEGFYFFNCWINRHLEGLKLKLNDKFVLANSIEVSQILTPRDRIYLFKTLLNASDEQINSNKYKILSKNKFYYEEIYFNYDDLIQFREESLLNLFYSFLIDYKFFLINLFLLPLILLLLMEKVFRSIEKK